MRSFKSKTALLSAVAGVAMLAAACGPTTTPPTTNGGAAYDFSYTAAKPTKTGGTVVFGDWQTVQDDSGGLNWYDLQLAPAVTTQNVVNAVWDSCVTQVPELKLGIKSWKPSLCTEVPTVANGGESADGKTTTFKLDPAAKWSDGQPITADDELFSYAIMMSADPNLAGDPYPFSGISAVTKVDDHTVKIEWKNAYASYLNAFLSPEPVHAYPGAFVGGALVPAVMDKVVGQDNFNYKPVASNGPYMVQDFGTDGTITMVPNPNYTSHYFQKPVLDKLIFKPSGSKDVMIQAYKTSNYDFVTDFTIADLPKFAGIAANEVEQNPAIEYEHLEFSQRPTALSAAHNNGASVFSGTNGALVRKALVEGFDRCAAITATLGKDCNDPNVHTNELSTPVDPSFDPNVSIPKYDLNQAGKDLDAAGYKLGGKKNLRQFPDGTDFTISIVSTVGNQLRATWQQLIANAWGNLGIKVLVVNDTKIFASYATGGILSNGTFDVALFAFSNPSDPDSVTQNVGSANIPSKTLPGGANYSGVNDPKVDGYLVTGVQTIDPAARIKVYHDLYAYMTDQNFFLPLYIRPEINLVKTTLGNFKSRADSAGPTWNVSDWFQTATS